MRRSSRRCAASIGGLRPGLARSETGTRWEYSFSPVDGGTQLTEWWEFPPAGVTLFEEKFGPAKAEELIADRSKLARSEISVTLAAIKRSAEAD